MGIFYKNLWRDSTQSRLKPSNVLRVRLANTNAAGEYVKRVTNRNQTKTTPLRPIQQPMGQLNVCNEPAATTVSQQQLSAVQA